MRNIQNTKLAIVGLGYVGLPLAVEFGKHYDTVGFDINQARIDELASGRDKTLEVDAAELAAATRLRFTAKLDDLREVRQLDGCRRNCRRGHARRYALASGARLALDHHLVADLGDSIELLGKGHR